MSDSSMTPVPRPTFRHLFGISPKMHKGADGELVLTRSLSNRLILIAGAITIPALAAWYIHDALKTGELWQLILLPPLLLIWLPWSVVSVTFDRNHGLMRLRRSFYPLRRIRERSLGDLRTVLVVKFRNMKYGHVRLVFGESEPRTVEVSGFWSVASAQQFAAKLSEFLGVPLEETTFSPKQGKSTA